MTANAILEIKKIRHLLKGNFLRLKFDNPLIIIESNDSKKEFKHYIYKRFSETLRIDAEFSFYNSFSELIFLELFSPNQTSSSFNFLLQQTIELFIGQIPLFEINNMIRKFFKITSWNLVNPNILVRFISIYNELIEAKGFKYTKESKEKKQSEKSLNREFIALHIEKIRSLIDNGDFLVSGILINGLFRLNPWNSLGIWEKKVLSEQILKILVRTQNLSLISKFYFMEFEYYCFLEKESDFSKICLFLSSIYHRLAPRIKLNRTLKKLLKIKNNYFFSHTIFCNFGLNDSLVFEIPKKFKNFFGINTNFMSLLKPRWINKVKKSIKAKNVLEKIKGIFATYNSITINSLKNFLKLDSRDLEYFLLSYFKENSNSLIIDHYQGILYCNLT